MIRKKYYFNGRVQGVGFRYTAKMQADKLGVTGYVQNLYDGRVLMEAQGDEAILKRLITSLATGMFINITDIEEEEMPIQNQEKGFRCVY